MKLWLSVLVKEAGRVVKGPSIVKGDSYETLGSVVERLSGEFSQRTVNQLIICMPKKEMMSFNRKEMMSLFFGQPTDPFSWRKVPVKQNIK